LINPVPRAEPFDHGDWLFELKFDGFRAAADTVRGQLISRNGARLRRFEGVLDRLPKGHVFDGELVVLDDAGRPLFHELLFGRGRPTYARSTGPWSRRIWKLARWHKVLNRTYSQRHGRAEWFRERRRLARLMGSQRVEGVPKMDAKVAARGARNGGAP
jgi:hypothetical protein